MNTNTQSPAVVRDAFVTPISTHVRNHIGDSVVIDACNQLVCHIDGPDHAAKAAQVVRACNSHAQLVAALEWTQKILCAYLDAETQAERDYLWKDVEHAHKTNSTALQAAKE